MFGSDVLEVVIGLVLVYFIVSLVCSAANEWVARIFAMRAKTLEAGILTLLSGDEPLKNHIYNHPLVKGLSRKGWWERQAEKRADKVAKVPILKKAPPAKPSPGPSNMSARRFALVLFDTLMEAGGRPAVPSSSRSTASDDEAGAGDIDEQGKSRALQLAAGKVMESLANGIDKLAANDEVKKTLRALLQSAESQVDRWDSALAAFRGSVERWFDDGMDRVTGWYKRKAQLIILVLAAIICLGLNVDTFAIANGLAQDSTLRASVVAAAEARAQRPAPAGAEAEIDVSELRDELSGLQLPIGWSTDDARPTRVPDSFAGWIVKLVGVMFTALAVALGAPFWFDLLNRLVSLRASGKQPPRAEESETTGPAAQNS